MQTPRLFLLLSFFSFFIFGLLTEQHGVHASSRHHNHIKNRKHGHVGGFSAQKLFVFGDSYADTGNTQKSEKSPAWSIPYGITFPGKPSGRFSNGRVFTDYIAQFLGLKSPIPYNFRKLGRLQYGMNFAVGGTGVFEAFGPPNMTTQIEELQGLIKDSVYTQKDIHSSLVLVSLSGNDYAAYIASNKSILELPGFISQVVNQLKVNLKQIHELGAERVAVAGLAPLGCLPRQTIDSSYEYCNPIENGLVFLHNLWLKKAVAELNHETNNSTFFIINLYDAFQKILHPKGASNFPTPLKPCCVGINRTSVCAMVDENGNKMYTVCEDPNSAFFWDYAHPTQAGWSAVYNSLIGELQKELH